MQLSSETWAHVAKAATLLLKQWHASLVLTSAWTVLHVYAA